MAYLNKFSSTSGLPSPLSQVQDAVKRVLDPVVDALNTARAWIDAHPVPSGTGWRHVTAGVEDAAASTPIYTQVGAAAASHVHAATDITSGTLSTDRYSAYADLVAESKIGTGSTQVAAGNHSHTYSDVGAAASSHTHDASAITSGTIDNARFSAYSDLSAESKIGTSSTQVAAGDHNHSGVYAAASGGSWTDVSSFSNSWVNYNTSTDYGAAYIKDPWGWVHLRGVIKSGTVGSAAFTLPSGYRPAKTIAFPVMSNGVAAYLYITSSGGVVPSTGCNNAWVQMFSCHFYADGS